MYYPMSSREKSVFLKMGTFLMGTFLIAFRMRSCVRYLLVLIQEAAKLGCKFLHFHDTIAVVLDVSGGYFGFLQ